MAVHTKRYHTMSVNTKRVVKNRRVSSVRGNYQSTAGNWGKNGQRSHAVTPLFRRFQSAAYDARNADRSFTDYQQHSNRTRTQCPNVGLAGIPANVLPNDDVLPVSYLLKISKTIVDNLLPFQRQDVAFGVRQQGRVLIANEMGFENSIEALALADYYRHDWPLLIVTPESKKNSWLSLIKNHMPSVVCLLTRPTLEANYHDSTVFIADYETLDTCDAINMGMLILDESHMLKNALDMCTEIAIKLADKAKHVVLLSEMLALSQPVKLYPLLRMLDQNFLSYKDYTDRYCAGHWRCSEWIVSGQSHSDELKAVLFNKYMIRRTKEELLLQPTENHREPVYLNPASMKATKTLTNFRENVALTMGRITTEILSQYSSVTATVKCDAICSYVASIVKQNIKFIIYAHHENVLDAIGETLRYLRVGHIRADRVSHPDVFQNKVHHFQTKKSCLAAVLSLTKDYGDITLNAARLVLFAELNLDPNILSRAESRAHRSNHIGEVNKATCRYLLARDSADDIIWRILYCNRDALNIDRKHTVDPTAIGIDIKTEDTKINIRGSANLSPAGDIHIKPESTDNETNLNRDDVSPMEMQAGDIKSEPADSNATIRRSSVEASPTHLQAYNMKDEFTDDEFTYDDFASISDEDSSMKSEAEAEITENVNLNSEGLRQLPASDIESLLSSDGDEWVMKIDIISSQLLNDGNDEYF